MNEHLRAFEHMTYSAEQLLADEHNSLEIQQSAISLKKSVQPCIEELKKSASRLQRLVLSCSHELYQAENVWLSKPRIAEAAKQEIWEQLGEISGRSIRILNLGTPCKGDAVKRANKAWDGQVEYLRKKWFVDDKGQFKQGIGWGEKKGFVQQIPVKINYLSDELNRIIRESLNLIYQEAVSIELELISPYISLLDKEAKAHYSKQIDLIMSELEDKFTNPTEHLPNHLLKFKTAINSDLYALVENGWSDIYWDNFLKFKNTVSSKMEKFITAIFDDRVKLATKALEQAIAFYNYFLERQERYQQETPEQREAEKAWIDQQRQQLEQVQNGIEAILSADAD
jgi:hypothetical protein